MKRAAPFALDREGFQNMLDDKGILEKQNLLSASD